MTDKLRPNHPPEPIWNRPGLDQLDYRIGDYNRFKQRLLAALTTALRPPVGIPGKAPLAALTTRDDSDPAIALLDAWAVVADVLTFYQERIANEGYLRTATERLSVLELARAIGYELDPGVAASTLFSFQVEDAPGSPTVVPIPERTQIMSVPVKDELPQIFETIEPFTAYLAWNGLRPRSTRPQRLYPHTRQLYLAGTSTQLQAGDLLLLVDDVPERQTFLLLLHTVTPNPTADYTLVQWSQSIPPVNAPLRRPQLFAFRLQAHLFGYNAPNWETMPAEVKLAAIEKGGGTIQGGVFRSETDGLTWAAASSGLPDSDILCVAARNNLIFAGTPNKGLFRSTDNGQTWSAANEGITSMNILVMHISSKDSVFNEAIFAGTPNGGVFRSKDQGQNWVPINQGTVRSQRVGDSENWEAVINSVPNTVVRSLLTYENESAGLLGTVRIAANQTVTDLGGAAPFDQSLSNNDVVRLMLGTFSQRRRIIANPSANSFIIDEPFELPEANGFFATVTVTFTLDGEELEEKLTISSGTVAFEIANSRVTGTGTTFTELLDFQDEVASREGVTDVEISEIVIEFLGKTFQVTESGGSFDIESDTELLVEPIAGIELFENNSYLLVGTDEGVYRAAIKSDNNQGRSWYLGEGTDARSILALAYISGDRVLAGTDDGILTSNNNGASWDRVWDSTQFASRKILSLSHYGDWLFAGTSQGIYRAAVPAANASPDWLAINGAAGELAVRAITSLATYNRDGTRYLFAATDDGIFVSTNSDGAAASVTWQRISQDLATQSAISLAVDDISQTLFAGTEFSSFLPSKADVETADAATNEETTEATPEKVEWPDLVIQDPRQLDLDTLYPQILPDSWVVLVDDRDPQNPEEQAEPRYAVRQVPAIVPIDRQDFGLVAKISRLELDVAVDPSQFGLRTTEVFGQSTELALAPEPLTVTDRQREILTDPIAQDTVYLLTFVQNLQAHQVVMVNGKHMRMQLADVGGIVRSRHDWQPRNTGLHNLTINALVTDQKGLIREPNEDLNTLLAATNEGLYYSRDGGENWASFANLRFKTIQSLHQFESILWAGVDQKLYQFDTDAQRWRSVSIPAENTILSFLTCELPISPPASSWIIDVVSGITLTIPAAALTELGNQTVITTNQDGQWLTFWVNVQRLIAQAERDGRNLSALSQLQAAVQFLIVDYLASQQTRIVTKLVDNSGTQQLLINRIFDPELSKPRDFKVGGTVWFAGTDRGLFRSTDRGRRWEYLPSLRDCQIQTLCDRTSSERQELFAATDRGLYYSVNSGQSWQLLDDDWDLKNPLTVYAMAKRGAAGNIWLGTNQGLYRLGTTVTTPPERVPGLSDRTIHSLYFDGAILYAGTDQGSYRSSSPRQSWEAIDAGLTAAAGRALLVQDGQLLVGTEQGIFATPTNGQRVDPVDWSRSNTGIVNSQILSLASSPDATTILAGTTAGLYRSTSAGRTWAPFDDELDQANAPGKLTIQVVFQAASHGWFVGTPEGVFVYAASPDQPDRDRWQLVGRDTLPYPNVRAMAMRGDWLLIGTINGGLFKLDLRQLNPQTRGQTPADQRWQPTGLNNTDVQAIAVGSRFLYVGTAGDGLYRSSDGGTIWEHITEQRSGVGTLVSEGNQVTWRGVDSADRRLQVGDQITAAGQSRTIVEFANSAQPVRFVVDEPFRPNLQNQTAFTISSGLTNLDITALQLAASEEREADSQPPLYAGTNGSGVFRSDDGGDRWQQVINNLDDLSIRCLLSEGTETLWAGTATAGVFRSINRGELWATATTNLTNTDVRALLRPNASTLLAGGMGILKSADGLTVKPIQRHDVVHVVKPPQILEPGSDPQRRQQVDPQLPPPPQGYQWLLRDKDNFLGLLDTTVEQVFPLLPAAEDDAVVSEQAHIQYPPTDQQLPILTLQAAITHSYDPETVTIAANVVRATHGETAEEILGSGDGTTAKQSFVLKKPPLTYVPATNTSGADSTLEVRVDDVLWAEESSLYSLQPQTQAYIIRIEDDGTTTVTFGDGRKGARPPSGQENITARYRSGIGTDGQVGANRLSILKTRPQGIAEVTNSLAATGAANRESLAAARTNAPPTARTLGRIVSLQDFQDFAQGFSGIGKALAVELWNGNAPVVHITIAGAEGAIIPTTAALYTSLVTAIKQARDPLQQVEVATYERLFFNLEGRILLDARYQVATVEPQLITALQRTFDFDRRGFGQAVTSAEVIDALQAIAGVVAVDLDALYIAGRSRALNDTLVAQTARYNADTDTIQAAQLLQLSPAGIQLNFVSTL